MKLDLYNGDCMDVMARYPDNYFDLAVVDPPYREVNQPIKEMRSNAVGGMDKFGSKPTSKYFKELLRVSENQVIWGANNFRLEPYKGFIIWDKIITGVKGKYSSCEIASISELLGTVSNTFRLSAQSINEIKIHPTQKPIELYKWIYQNYATEGMKILDTHLGSGSNAIAAYEMNMAEFVGAELDADYFEAASARIERAMGQGKLF